MTVAPPCVPLAHLPTPLEPLPRLTRELGGPEIWIKRDDCTGLAGGGNKARKLEWLLAEARDQGAEVVLTGGSMQSNHARQTAAACARHGYPCELFLNPRVPRPGARYRRSGNALLSRLLGARVHELAPGEDADAAVEAREAELAAGARRVYAIPTGGSTPTGARAYRACAREIAEQARAQGMSVDHLVHASASGGTQAGLAVGLAEHAPGTRLHAIAVGDDPAARARACVAGMHDGPAPAPSALECDPRFLGAGYGVPTAAGDAAVRTLATTEGILLDPVYTGKAMAGLIAGVREGRFRRGEVVVFLHTGGWPALFGYEED